MEKSKLLTIAVVFLLILNFGTLGFLLFSGAKDGFFRQHHEGDREPRQIIIHELHFDKNQTIAYDKCIQLHRGEIRNIQDSIRNTKNELYLLLNQKSINTVKKDSLILILGHLQQEIEATHFNHFLNIKKLCNKNQLHDFEALTQELSRIFSKDRKPRHD